MSILERIFGGNQDQQQQQPQGQQVQQTQEPPKEPTLEERFGAVWAPEDPAKAPKPFNVSEINDLSKLPEVLSQQNYLQGTSQEDLQAIANGGEQAVAAFGKILNQVAQTVAAQSITAAGKLVENGVTKTVPMLDGRMNSLLRSSRVQEAISSSNPLVSNPMFAPMVEIFKNQVLAKYPNANEQEVASMTNDYFNELSKSMQPKAAQDPSKVDGTDWANFFKPN